MIVKTSTPSDIMSWTFEQVLDHIQDPPGIKINKKIRFEILRAMFSAIKGDLTPDIALFFLDESTNKKQIIATAGSGKTFCITAYGAYKKLLYSIDNSKKDLHGLDLLYLVFNNHNTEPIKQAHETVVERILKSRMKGVNIDAECRSHTIHSFCSTWLTTLQTECNIEGFVLAESDADVDRMAVAAIKFLNKKFPETKRKISSIDLVKITSDSKIYLTEVEDLMDAYPKIQLTEEQLRFVVEAFEKRKRIAKVYEYVDMLYLIYLQLKNNTEVQERLRSYYRIIFFDEVQDASPISREIVKMLVTDETEFVAIGDDDQTINEFAGADVKEILKLSEHYTGMKVNSLVTNRRCPSNIVELSSMIIDENTERFEKERNSIKPPSELTLESYTTKESEAEIIFQRVLKIPESEHRNTAIIFRNKMNGMRIIEKFQESQMPYTIVSAYAPEDHIYMKTIREVLSSIHGNMVTKQHVPMYKILPISSEEWFTVIGYDPSTKEFENFKPSRDFKSYDFSGVRNQQKFVEVLLKIDSLADELDHKPMKDYIDEVFELVELYYWKDVKRYSTDPILDAHIEKKAKFYFSSDMKYEDFSKRYIAEREAQQAINRVKEGVQIGTIHSVKGMGYKNLIITGLDERIFPSLDIEHSISLESRIKKEESENRLFFVALTRAEDKVHIYYNENSPSIYATKVRDFLEGRAKINKSKPKIEELDFNFDDFLDTLITGIDPNKESTENVVEEDTSNEQDKHTMNNFLSRLK